MELSCNPKPYFKKKNLFFYSELAAKNRRTQNFKHQGSNPESEWSMTKGFESLFDDSELSL